MQDPNYPLKAHVNIVKQTQGKTHIGRYKLPTDNRSGFDLKSRLEQIGLNKKTLSVPQLPVGEVSVTHEG